MLNASTPVHITIAYKAQRTSYAFLGLLPNLVTWLTLLVTLLPSLVT